MDTQINDASKIVTSAILGYDFKRIIVNGKDYVIKPPTIHQICGATYWLSDIKEGNTLRELILSMNKFDNICRALSYFIADDESLTEELTGGTLDEVLEGLETAFQLIDTENFLTLSVLTRSAKRLIARQR